MSAYRSLGVALVLMVGSAAAASAAPGDHAWSTGWTVNGAGAGTDASGAVASAGTFSGTVNFGGGALTSMAAADVYVVKLDADGQHVWSGAYPPTDYVVVSAIAESPAGDTYVAGQLSKGGTIDFGGGPIGGGFGEAWAVRFDPDGNHVWSDSFGRGWIGDIDATNGAVAFAVRTAGTMNFGGSDLGTTNGAQAVAVKLAPNGTHIWSAEYGDAATQAGIRVGLLDAGDLVLLATVRGTIDFGGGALGADASADDFALARFDAAGGHLWSRIYNGTFGVFGILYAGMDVTPSGAIAITSQFTGTIDFGGGPLTTAGLDLFVARIDASGNEVWSEAFGGNGDDCGMSVAFDSADHLLVAGYYGDAIDFGGGTLPFVGSKDAFVVSLDTGGAHDWSAGFGTTVSESRCGVSATPTGAAILDVSGGVDLDFGGGAVANATYYVAKLEGEELVAAPWSATPGPVRLAAAPNPFGMGTTIRLTGLAGVRGAAPLLVLFDVAGRRVRTLEAPASGGAIETFWDGRDDAGMDVVPGVYFARLEGVGDEGSWRLVRVR